MKYMYILNTYYIFSTKLYRIRFFFFLTHQFYYNIMSYVQQKSNNYKQVKQQHHFIGFHFE